MRNILWTIGLIFVLMSEASARQVEVYNCTFRNAPSLISEELMFIHDVQRGEFLVYDGMIHFVEGKPIPAELSSDTRSKKLVLRWVLFAPDRSGTVAKLSYRLAYFKETSKVVLSVQAMGFANQYNARGNCKKSKSNI